MRLVVTMLLAALMLAPAEAAEITGSGSTFIFPVMAQWSAAYEQASGVSIAYQPVGSTAGIADIEAGRVDFGVSDMPLPADQLDREGLAQFPIIVGGIVPIINVPGIAPGQMHFTGPLLADIFLGAVTKWDDPAIAGLNPGLKLPHLSIFVIHRSDGSGTTFNWTEYLSQVSQKWAGQVGAGTLVAWPTGFGAKGNGKVGAYVGMVKGAIGFVEFAYVTQNNLTYGLVRNRAGNDVEPALASFDAATRDVAWQEDAGIHAILNNAARADAFPVVAASYVLLRRHPKDPAQRRLVLAFLHWALTVGQSAAIALNYVPLPPPLVDRVEAYWRRSLGAEPPA